jgi:hypothetical protein
MGETLLTWVATVQGLYYVATGLLPLVSMRTFEAITGPKLEHWLVKTVGLLVTVAGAVCLLAVWLGRFTPEVALLALGNAAALAAIDVYYVSIRRIAPIYLADAAAETVLLLGWSLGWWLGGVTR